MLNRRGLTNKMTHFNEVKWLLSQALVLTYCHLDRPVSIQCDLIQKGFGAVLIQDGTAVTSLTDTKQRYAQIEKDASIRVLVRKVQSINIWWQAGEFSGHNPLESIVVTSSRPYTTSRNDNGTLQAILRSNLRACKAPVSDPLSITSIFYHNKRPAGACVRVDKNGKLSSHCRAEVKREKQKTTSLFSNLGKSVIIQGWPNSKAELYHPTADPFI